MKEEAINYQYSLDLLQRFNKLVEENHLLSKHFSREGYNLLERFQAQIFADIKTWTSTKNLPNHNTSFIITVKILLTGLAMTFLSLVGGGYLLLTKRKVLIFTEDKVDGSYSNDPRLNSLYEALNLEDSTFLEVVHTVPNAQTFKKFFNRKRSVIYLEVADFLLWPISIFLNARVKDIIGELDFTNFSLDEREFVREELKKIGVSVYASLLKLWFFRILFRLARPKIVFSIDDTRHYNEFVEAGKKVGIPTYGIQHGHFTKYHAGWLKMTNFSSEIMRPSKLLVWSKYWKDELLSLGTYFKEDEIEIGGVKAHLESGRDFDPNRKAILIPYEKDAPKEEVKEFIENVLSCGQYEIIFKLREGMGNTDNQLREYGLDNIGITAVKSDREVLERVGLVAGTYSTYLYDSVENLIPTAIIRSSNDYGEGMVKNGLADIIEKQGLCEKVGELLKLTSEEIRHRKEILQGKERVILSQTIRTIIQKHVSA